MYYTKLKLNGSSRPPCERSLTSSREALPHHMWSVTATFPISTVKQ